MALLYHHEGRKDVEYTMKVTGAFNEPLDRQLTERIRISNFTGLILLNRKNELGGAVVERDKYKYRKLGPESK